MSGVAEDAAAIIAQIVSNRTSDSRADTQAQVWNDLCTLGFDRIGVAASDGGSGGDLEDLASVVRSVASHALSMPIVETALAEWLRSSDLRIAPRQTTIAFAEHGLEPGDAVVSGTIIGVPWVETSTAVLVPFEGRVALVDLGHSGVAKVERTNLSKETRTDLNLANAPVLVLDGSDGQELLRRYELLRVAQLLGLCEGTLSLTKAYVQSREQFGGPLVRLPAVGRNLAMLRIKLLEAEVAFTRALDKHDGPKSEFLGALLGARVVVSASASTLASLSHQMHGAIGITQEYPLHEFTKRLWSWRDEPVRADHAAQLLGDSTALGEAHFWNVLTA